MLKYIIGLLALSTSLLAQAEGDIPGQRLIGSNETDVLALVIPNLTLSALPAEVGSHSLNINFTGLVAATDYAIGFEGPPPSLLCPLVSVRVSADNQLQADFLSASATACTPATGTYKILILRLH